MGPTGQIEDLLVEPRLGGTRLGDGARRDRPQPAEAAEDGALPGSVVAGEEERLLAVKLCSQQRPSVRSRQQSHRPSRPLLHSLKVRCSTSMTSFGVRIVTSSNSMQSPTLIELESAASFWRRRSFMREKSSATRPALPESCLRVVIDCTAPHAAPCPHDHCWHSWKNATQIPATIVRLTSTAITIMYWCPTTPRTSAISCRLAIAFFFR